MQLVEINFNRVFYIPEKLREVTEITSDLEKLENELKQLEQSLQL
jgi:type I restriction enzyme M protein